MCLGQRVLSNIPWDIPVNYERDSNLAIYKDTSSPNQADIYSVGVLLLELVTCEKPVRGQIPDVRGCCPPALVPPLQRCLSVDPDARPTAPELYYELLQLRPG